MVAPAPAPGDEVGAGRDEPRAAEARLGRAVPWLAVLVALVVALTTYRDHGATWDEGVQARYGELVLRYFESGGEDRACNEYIDLRYYGPLFELVPAWFEHGEGPRKFEVRHLFLGLLWAVSLPAVWLFGRRLGGPLLGAFAVLALATHPRFFGHAFNNSKDMSFALTVTWFLAALAAAFGEPRVRWSRVALCGVAMGLVLCARPGGLPLLLLFAGSAALAWLVTRERDAEGPLRAAIGLVPKALAVVAIAWPIMVLPWPWAHERPIANPIAAIRKAADFPTTVNVLFDGRMILSDELPWDYLLRYLAIATPLPVLALAGLGLVLGARDQLRGWRTPRARLMVLVQVWLLVPLALYVLLRPNIHGGMRHFLFVLPALALLAARGAVGLVELARRPRARSVALAGVTVLLLLPVRDLVRLHPYQVAWYNALVGGVRGASDTDWTDYYLSSYAEAIRWVNAQAAREPERTFDVWIWAGPQVLLWAREYAAENVELSQSSGDKTGPLPADWYVGTTRYATHEHFPDAPVVHTVGRAGAVFAVVRAGEGGE